MTTHQRQLFHRYNAIVGQQLFDFGFLRGGKATQQNILLRSDVNAGPVALDQSAQATANAAVIAITHTTVFNKNAIEPFAVHLLLPAQVIIHFQFRHGAQFVNGIPQILLRPLARNFSIPHS